MRCPRDDFEALRCNQLLDEAEKLIDNQGVVSFRFAQIAKQAGCSTNTLYKYFESKEDVLVCLFLRNTTSTRIPVFIDENPDFDIYQRAVLPLLFTFEMVRRSSIFNILRLVSINSMFWQLASSEKIDVLRHRVNLFWSCIRQPIDAAVAAGELQATEVEVKELVQSLYFFLAGATSSCESRLMDEYYLTPDNETQYRHISHLMNRYRWKRPITKEMMQEMTRRISLFLDKGQGKVRSCQTCLAVGKCHHCGELAYQE
ncbi:MULTISPECIES: TetR/AcrR family transcriptional regulator [Shewanella]|uniref:TetR/AcrR family transcriptional regulator n=1 Tax=Shewanella TaxID=22 RepID=UPI001183073E|nr:MULTISPECIES: TetR/AcrR family transcriptional regulator [Shewanella]QYJ90298.1 TetR/AcrR family transcriptional regulator [Shewanella halotolerans]TVP11236.1 TetR family transcriptional regulator [Shewanella sp. KCT]